MKKTLLLSVLLASAVGSFAQGTVNFNNNVAFTSAAVTAQNGHADRLVYWTDNTTGLSGTNWAVQLFYGSDAGVLGSASNPSLTANSVDSTPSKFFPSGAQLGKWQPQTKTLPTTPAGGTVTLQVRVWDGSIYSTYAAAAANPLAITGASTPFSYTVPSGGTPPPAQFFMENLQSFTVGAAPEPSTIALGILGAASLLVVRRRK